MGRTPRPLGQATLLQLMVQFCGHNMLHPFFSDFSLSKVEKSNKQQILLKKSSLPENASEILVKFEFFW